MVLFYASDINKSNIKIFQALIAPCNILIIKVPKKSIRYLEWKILNDPFKIVAFKFMQDQSLLY